MDIAEKASDGKLWMINPNGTFEERLQNLEISNGLDWSPDHRTMFFVDSPTMQVHRFEFDAATGRVNKKRVLLTVPPDSGCPDGLTLSPSGNFLLVAQWGGYGVYIYEASSGKFLRKISLPVAHTTSCTWIGNDLYVTSAKKGRTLAQLESEPHAGGPHLPAPLRLNRISNALFCRCLCHSRFAANFGVKLGIQRPLLIWGGAGGFVIHSGLKSAEFV